MAYPNKSQKIIIVGGGVAGSEVGTLLGQRTKQHVEIISIEASPARQFGGWGFQSFPETENTNLALRKMYLSGDKEEILDWASNPNNRATWPEKYKDIKLNPDKIFPRALVREYVKWRRDQVKSNYVSYTSIAGEAMRVDIDKQKQKVRVTLKSGEVITGDRLVLASGSIAVKIPDYLQAFENHDHVIADPLIIEGHEARARIPLGSKVLILGTGLTGSEQAKILLDAGHEDLTLFSREGKLHYHYPLLQENKPLFLAERPGFLIAETAEEFEAGFIELYRQYRKKGHSPEDILASIRPHWDRVRGELGGCLKAIEKLTPHKRLLAVNSIGLSAEVSAILENAIEKGYLSQKKGEIKNVSEKDGKFLVDLGGDNRTEPETITVDYIINGIGRTIVRHPLWENLLRDGHANKHASIGVQVSERGQMMDANGAYSNLVYVVGMARAGDHAYRHGFLGNTAFNVPQIRFHCGGTVDAILESLPNPELEYKSDIIAGLPRFDI